MEYSSKSPRARQPRFDKPILGPMARRDDEDEAGVGATERDWVDRLIERLTRLPTGLRVMLGNYCPRCEGWLSPENSICGTCEEEFRQAFPDERASQEQMLKRWAKGQWPVSRKER